MTRRREVPTLAFTVPEAAQAIRLSEHTLRVWIKEGIVRVVRWQSLDLVPRVELDRLIVDALENGGTLPAVASSPATTPLPAGAVGAGELGAAGLTSLRGSGDAPAAPTNKKRTGALSAPALQNNAG